MCDNVDRLSVFARCASFYIFFHFEVLFVVDGNVLCLCFLSAQRMFPGRMFLLFMNEESIRWPMDVFLIVLIQFDDASVFGLPFACVIGFFFFSI